MTEVEVPGGVITVSFPITQEQADHIREVFTEMRPAPTDTSWITFEKRSRSPWTRIRRLWRREGLAKREQRRIKRAFLAAQGSPHMQVRVVAHSHVSPERGIFDLELADPDAPCPAQQPAAPVE